MSTSESGFDSSVGNETQDTGTPAPTQTTLTWDPLSETHQTVDLPWDAYSDGSTPKFTDANPEGHPIGEVLPIIVNSDGSKSITGDRNVDATLIGSKWGTLNLTYSFPTSGSNYNGSGFDS